MAKGIIQYCVCVCGAYSTYWILTYTAYRARMHKHDDCLQSAMVSALTTVSVWADFGFWKAIPTCKNRRSGRSPIADTRSLLLWTILYNYRFIPFTASKRLFVFV